MPAASYFSPIKAISIHSHSDLHNCFNKGGHLRSIPHSYNTVWNYQGNCKQEVGLKSLSLKVTLPTFAKWECDLPFHSCSCSFRQIDDTPTVSIFDTEHFTHGRYNVRKKSYWSKLQACQIHALPVSVNYPKSLSFHQWIENFQLVLFMQSSIRTYLL